MDPFGGFGMIGFSILDSLFPFMFLFIFGLIAYTVFKGIKQNMHNDRQPIIPVNAKIVTKRQDTSHHHHGSSDHIHHSSSTWYYVTFEMTNGERMELQVSPQEFGMMVEGDEGTLQFQGTRFISFTR